MIFQGIKGFFLVIEGLDGSGKTEISRHLMEIIQFANTKSTNSRDDIIKLTFEPHDPSCAGLFIRQVLARKRNYDPRTLALAFAANRADHLTRDIVPFLQRSNNRMVICDRYYLSSLVYQTNDEISMEEIMHLNKGALRPDLIIFLNASDNVCYQRMRARDESKELFESNLRKTREKYFSAIKFLQQRGDRIVEVNADGNKSEVLNEILEVLKIHGPKWLDTQAVLPLDLDLKSPLSFVAVDENLKIRLTSFVSDVLGRYEVESSSTSFNIFNLKKIFEDEVFSLTETQIAALFLNYLEISGFKILHEIPWSETEGLDLEYVMPLGIRQRGIALILSKSQSYTVIAKKELFVDELGADPALLNLSDFVVCLDFSGGIVGLKYYEPDLILRISRKSPSTILITRANICDMALAIALATVADNAILLDNSVVPNTQIPRLLEEWQLGDYWSLAINLVSSS